MRGEKAADFDIAGITSGSPPHARGKVPVARSLDVAPGITPACAGKSTGSCCPVCAPRDHPRMRGEKHIAGWATLTRSGSPPHARGKEFLNADCPHICGITPACAGKSSTSSTKKMRSGDHPRMRGEKQQAMQMQAMQQGSPPHARGKVRMSSALLGHFGITPACAGKSRGRRGNGRRVRDHPRMRGEKRRYSTS